MEAAPFLHRPFHIAKSPARVFGPALEESDLGVLTSQCLDGRIPDKRTLIDETRLGRTTAIHATPRPTGSSPSKMLGSSSSLHVGFTLDLDAVKDYG